MKKLLQKLWREEGGVTSIEYALIASLIAIVAVVAVVAVGDGAKTSFEKVGNCVHAPSSQTCPG